MSGVEVDFVINFVVVERLAALPESDLHLLEELVDLCDLHPDADFIANDVLAIVDEEAHELREVGRQVLIYSRLNFLGITNDWHDVLQEEGGVVEVFKLVKSDLLLDVRGEEVLPVLL